MNQMPSPKQFKMQQTTPAIFIDGEAGTTGLQIRERLEGMTSVRLISIDPAKRKDPAARKEMMRQADLLILCLHDDHAREAVAMAAELGADAPRILDASTAHRVAADWTYGFAELAPGIDNAIRKATKVSNPGCYPTCAIALLRPLIDAGLMPASQPLAINAVSGYSGGGRAMIEGYKAGTSPSFELYGLGLEHKHVPEIMHYTGLTTRPIFVPSVGNFEQGMLVSIPLHLDTLPGKPSGADLEKALIKYYAGSEFVKVIDAAAQKAESGKLEAESLNGTNMLELRVVANEARRHAVLIGKVDNLGKGASGAAVQNLKLMLGV
ncbi:MAG: N-acetyl-gamma-glutamyl-phosphate reductase [Beijerinckiaceae bacterium]